MNGSWFSVEAYRLCCQGHRLHAGEAGGVRRAVGELAGEGVVDGGEGPHAVGRAGVEDGADARRVEYRGDAAVHDEDLAVDAFGGGAGEVGDQRGDVLG